MNHVFFSPGFCVSLGHKFKLYDISLCSQSIHQKETSLSGFSETHPHSIHLQLIYHNIKIKFIHICHHFFMTKPVFLLQNALKLTYLNVEFMRGEGEGAGAARDRG